MQICACAWIYRWTKKLGPMARRSTSHRAAVGRGPPGLWAVADLRSLGSWYIKCIDESFLRVLSSLPLICHGLSDLGSPILICIIMKCTYDLSHVKGTQSAMGTADLDTTFVSLKTVYLNPKSNERVGYM